MNENEEDGLAEEDGLVLTVYIVGAAFLGLSLIIGAFTWLL